MKKFPSKIVFILTQLLLLSGCGALIDYAHVSIAPMHFCMSNFVGGNDAPEDYKRKICEKSVADQEKWSKEYDEKQKAQGNSTSTGDVLRAVAQVGIAVAEAKADERLQRKQQVAGKDTNKNSSSSIDPSNYESQKSDSEAEFNAKVKGRPCYPEYLIAVAGGMNTSYDYFLYGLNDTMREFLHNLERLTNPRKEYQDEIKRLTNRLQARIENNWLSDRGRKMDQCRDYYYLNYLRNVIPLAPFIKNYGSFSIDDINRNRREIIGY